MINMINNDKNTTRLLYIPMHCCNALQWAVWDTILCNPWKFVVWYNHQWFTPGTTIELVSPLLSNSQGLFLNGGGEGGGWDTTYFGIFRTFDKWSFCVREIEFLMKLRWTISFKSSPASSALPIQQDSTEETHCF